MTNDEQFEAAWTELGKRLLRHATRNDSDDERTMWAKIAEMTDEANNAMTMVRSEHDYQRGVLIVMRPD